MPDIFISYSREDQTIARRFAEGFGREGFDVWWDQTLNPGDAYDNVTEMALKEAKAVVVLWSKKSVDSRWVRAEATLANRNHTLVPAMIEPCERPVMFDLTHTMDLSHWKGDPNDKAWQAYVAGVRRFVQKDALVGSVALVQPAVKNRKYVSTAIVISVAALVVAGIVMWAMNRTPGPAAKPATAVTTALAATPEVTLAVLPFADMSPGKDQEYFADGLSEEILNHVAQIEGLLVTARTSSFSFKGRNEDTRVIGEKLGVAHLLEGSVRKDGNSLRITAQLINTRNGTHLWSKTYDRETSKVFEVQEEIARDVVKVLSVKLDVGEIRRADGGTADLEAYDRYLRGNADFQAGRLADALQHFREATELDPNYLAAWVSTFHMVGVVGLPFNEVSRERASILNRIEAMAPGSWQVLLLRAQRLRVWERPYEAQLAFEAAFAAADKAGSKVGRTSIGAYDAFRRRAVGDLSGAQKLWQPMVKADPASYSLSFWRYRDLFSLGRSTEALVEMDRSKTLGGYEASGETDFDLVMDLRFRKGPSPATIWNTYSALVKKDPFLQSLFARRDDPAAARMVLQQAFDKPGPPRVANDRIALWADYFGDRDLALSAMRRVLSSGPGGSFPVNYLWLPNATDLRADPRFKDIVRDLGFVEYWRRSGNWGDYCKPVGTDDFECR